MEFYEGHSDGDVIHGGGKYVAKHGVGHEIFNFSKRDDGSCYGFVQTGRKEHINISRISKTEVNDSSNSLSGVLVIWTATHPEKGGRFVVGWYKNATVFANRQKLPKSLERKVTVKGEKHTMDSYCIKADKDQCTLLPIDERTCPIPKGKGGMGQANIWYADNPNSPKEVKDAIEKAKALANGAPHNAHHSNGKKWGKQDQDHKVRVEKAAIDEVLDYYS
jgi:hypothetical protein